MARVAIAALTGLSVWTGLYLYYIRRHAAAAVLWKSACLYLAAGTGMAFCFFQAAGFGLPYINCVRNELVYCWLLVIALIDGREKIIPKALTTAGLAGWGVLVLFSVGMGGGNLRNILFFSGGGLLLGGGMFFLCRIFSKGGIGMGDIRLFSVIGLLYGMNYTFSIVFFTILLMSVFGLAAAICRKKDLKSMVAMGPFTMASFCICCLLGV